MNTLITFGKYTAGFTLAAVVVEYGYQKHLHSKALKCMKDNQLAIITSGCESFPNEYLNNTKYRHTFTFTKHSTEKTEVVGAVCFIYQQYGNRKIEVYDNCRIDILPVAKYLSYKETPLWYKFTKLFGHYGEGGVIRITRSCRKITCETYHQKRTIGHPSF